MSSEFNFPVFAIAMSIIFFVWGGISYALPNFPGSPWLIIPGIVFLVLALASYFRK